MFSKIKIEDFKFKGTPKGKIKPNIEKKIKVDSLNLKVES
jgi:hypothetical protein